MLIPRQRWTWLIILALGLAACGSAAPAPAAPPSGNTASPAPAASVPKDQLVLAIGGESEDGYDPTLGWGRYGSPLFQSTLLRRDEQLKIVNDLATGYTVSDDKRTWTITIREDATFSDGQPLTAEDVAYTFSKAAESGGLTDVTVLDTATATGKYTVELRLKQPQSTFLNRLITLGIVPKHLHNADYARKPVGSGPYRFVQWDEGQQLIVEANPTYYGPAPQIKRLVFLFTAEDTAFAAVKSGQAQVASVPPALAVQKLDGMQLVAVKSVDNRGLMFPTVADTGQKTASGAAIGNNVTADLAIRQAVNYVLDRKALVAGILEGYGAPAYGPVTSLPWDQPDADIADANQAQAKSILDAAGWVDGNNDGVREKNGLAATFTIIYPASDSTRQALALAAADMIAPLGVKATVEGKSWDDIEKAMHSNVIVFGWGSHDQTEMYNLYHSSQAGQGYYNTGYYQNPAIDTMLDQAMGAPSEAEALVFWKNAQWNGSQGFTAKGDAAWAWMVNLYHTYFVSSCLDVGAPQVEPHGHGWPITSNIAAWRWTCP